MRLREEILFTNPDIMQEKLKKFDTFKSYEINSQ